MPPKARVSPFLLALCLIFLLIPDSGVADLKWMSTKEVAQSSQRAVLAECVSVEVKPVDEYGGNLFTFSTFRVLEGISGEIGDVFTLRLFGGRIGDTAIDAPLVPTFTTGEQVILLLGADNKDGYPTVFIQGVFRVATAPTTGELIVTTPVTGMTIYRASDGSPYASTPTMVPVKDFIYTLRRNG